MVGFHALCKRGCFVLCVSLCLPTLVAAAAAEASETKADVAAVHAWFEAHRFSSAERKKIRSGNVVLRNTPSDNPQAQHVTAFVVVQAPIQHVFHLITDFPQLVAYAPHVEKIEVLNQSKHQALVNYDLALPFGMRTRYRLQLNFEREGEVRRMAWHAVPWAGLKADETIASTTGYWLLEPAEDKAVTLLSYQTITDPGDVPFGFGWLVDALSRGGVIDLLESTKIRTEQQWGNHVGP